MALDVLELLKERVHFYVLIFSHLPYAPEIIISADADASRVLKSYAEDIGYGGACLTNDSKAHLAHIKLKDDVTISLRRINHTEIFYSKI